MSEGFEPKQFKSDEDLHEEQKPQFKPVEGGFVEKTAKENSEEVKEEAKKRTPIYLENGLDYWLELVDEYSNAAKRYMSDDYLQKLGERSPINIYLYKNYIKGRRSCAHSWPHNIEVGVKFLRENIDNLNDWKKKNNCPIEDLDISQLLIIEDYLKKLDRKQQDSAVIENGVKEIPPILQPYEKKIKDLEEKVDRKEVGKLSELDILANDIQKAGWSSLVRDIPCSMINVDYNSYIYRKKCEKWAKENNIEFPKDFFLNFENGFYEISTDARINNKLTAPILITEKIRRDGLNKKVIADFGYEIPAIQAADRVFEGAADDDENMPNIEGDMNIENISEPTELYVILSESLRNALTYSMVFNAKNKKSPENIKINTTPASKEIIINYRCSPEASIGDLQKMFEQNNYLSLLKKWKIEWKKIGPELVEIKIWYEN